MAEPLERISCYKKIQGGIIMKKRRFAYLSVIALLICAFLLMGFSCSISTANIQNATMTTGVDENGKPLDSVNEYPVNTAVFVSAELHNAPEDTTITFKWYYGERQIGEYSLSNTLSDQYINGYITADSMLQSGSYSVEIYIDERNEPDATLEFTVR